MTPAEMAELAAFLVPRLADEVAEKLSKQPRLVDRHKLADLIGLSVPTIDRRVRDGSIPVIRSGKRVLFDPTAVVAALSKGGSSDA